MNTPLTAETLVTAGNPASEWAPTTEGTPVRTGTLATTGAPETVGKLTHRRDVSYSRDARTSREAKNIGDFRDTSSWDARCCRDLRNIIDANSSRHAATPEFRGNSQKNVKIVKIIYFSLSYSYQNNEILSESATSADFLIRQRF